MPHVY